MCDKHIFFIVLNMALFACMKVSRFKVFCFNKLQIVLSRKCSFVAGRHGHSELILHSYNDIKY